MANEIQHGGRMRVPARRMPANAGPPATAMTPKEIFGIIRRHIFMIVFLTLLGTIAGGGSWYALQKYMPKYTSMGTIEVLPPTGINIDDFEKIQPNKDIFYEFRSTKAFGLKHQGFYQELIKYDKVRETKWYKKFDETPWYKLRESAPDADRFEDLKGNLSVSAARDMNHIRVSMTCGSPIEARDIVKEAIDHFLSEEDKKAESVEAPKLTDHRHARGEIKADLDAVEESLVALREVAGYSRLEKANFRDYLDAKLENLEKESNKLMSVIESMNTQVEILTIRSNAPDDNVVRDHVERDPVSIGLRRQVDSMEVELRRLQSQFGPNHKRLKENGNALGELKAALQKQQDKVAGIYRKSMLILAQEQRDVLKAQLGSQLKSIDKARIEYADVNRLRADYENKTTRRDEYIALLEEKDRYISDLETVKEAPDLSKVRWGIQPSIPMEMSGPLPHIYIPAGFLLGFMLGVGLSFAVEMLNDLMRSPSDVMKHLRSPLLGMICHKSQDRGVKRIDLYHVVRDAPYSIMSEAYRQFRTNLKLSGSDGHSQKTLLVTSGGAGDGKTTVAINTAYTFVADGKRVLLVDTNFRKPSTTVLFKRTMADGTGIDHPDLGLSNYLMNQCDHTSIIRTCEVEGLDIVDSGPLPLNPSELLGSDKMAQLIKMVREDYDYVIIDGPPMIVSEAKTLAAQVDGTVVVFNAEQTKRGAAQRTLRELNEVNANVVGTVLVGVKSMKGGYFHEVYDSYRRYQKVKPKKAQALKA